MGACKQAMSDASVTAEERSTRLCWWAADAQAEYPGKGCAIFSARSRKGREPDEVVGRGRGSAVVACGRRSKKDVLLTRRHPAFRSESRRWAAGFTKG